MPSSVMRAMSSADRRPRETASRTIASTALSVWLSLSPLLPLGPRSLLRSEPGRLRSESLIPDGKYAGQSTDTPTCVVRARRSWYSTSDSATAACLVTVYAENPGGVINPATDAVFTMWQSSPCSIIAGTNAWIPWTMPIRLTPTSHSQSDSVDSHSGPLTATPALLKSRWTRPKRDTVRCASASTEPFHATSVTVDVHSAP